MTKDVVKDPLTFEVFRHAISGLADEMAITILRTAHSQIVAASMDFSAALCAPDGSVIAQANTCPVHLGSIPDAMQAILAKFGDSVEPGDMYLLNDPDEGGMHLPDIFAVAPIFDGVDLLGFGATVVNHADVGGWIPGSMGVQSTSIFAEGIQIPPTRLIHRGIVNKETYALILRNVREPELLRGDLEAQFAANHAAAIGVRRLANRYGREEYPRLCTELMDYSETLLRGALAQVPEGRYSFDDQIDDDGLGSGPIPFHVTVSAANGEIEFDFTGSSPQVASALNATASFTKSATYAALQGALGTGIPANSGFYRPCKFIIPECSILNARRPAARGARGLVAYRIIDTVFGALAPIFPERVPAAGDGGPSAIAIGTVEDDGASSVTWDILCGAWGARADRDGVDGISPLGANIANTPIEELERTGRLRIDGYGYLPDSAGAGKWRGGLGPFRDLTFLSDSTLQIRSDRQKFLPYGLDGGCAGTPSSNTLAVPDQDLRALPSKVVIDVPSGTKLRHVTAGGGGHGYPSERDPELVARDVVDGKVTVSRARQDYGVAASADGSLDLEETARLRSVMSTSSGENTDPERT